MVCPEVTIQTILGTECIGDSLPKINTNFSTLGDAACDLITKVNELSSSVTSLSSTKANNLSVIDSPTIDLSYNSTTGVLSAVTTSFVATSSSPMVAKAWGVFNGVTPAILKNYNIAGFARTEQGKYTITFQNPMPNVNYAIVASTTSLGINWGMPVWHYVRNTVSTFDLWFGDSDNPTLYYDSGDFSVVVFS